MNVKPYDMQHDVIIACDFKSAEDTFKFLDLFRGEARKPFLKIGMELFYRVDISVTEIFIVCL